MKNKALKTLLTMALLFFAIVVLVPPVSAADIYVPDDYAKIQWAVDNATAGDTIIVRDGTYNENVDVNKRLTIQSENGSASTTVEAGDSDDHVFYVTTDYVNISGFTVTGATGGQKVGILIIGGADHCNITSNNISNNDGGINLFGSSNNMLMNNNVNANNINGIYLDSSSSNTATGWLTTNREDSA